MLKDNLRIVLWIVIVLTLGAVVMYTAHQETKYNSISNNSSDSTNVELDSCKTAIFQAERNAGYYLDSLIMTRDSLSIQYEKFDRYKDSVTLINSKLTERLAIADYKLLRIREYNRIAAQRNNIKYLRGWINRVLN